MNTTKTKQLHELIYMTPEHYSEDYTERYLRWCMNRSQDLDQDLQRLLANSSISKWYNHEFAKLEERIISMLEPQHGKISYKQARTIFGSIVAEMFIKYPMPLIDQARKLNINAN